MSLQKTKSNTLRSIIVERDYNSTASQPMAIARLELYIVVLQIFFIFWAAGLSNRGK
jgi:hypothetical protein